MHKGTGFTFQQTQWVGAKQGLRRIGRPRLLTQSWPSHRSKGDLSSWPRGIWFKLQRRKAEIGWCETHIVSGFFGVMMVFGYPVACLEGNWISFAIRFNKHFPIRNHQGRTCVMRYLPLPKVKLKFQLGTIYLITQLSNSFWDIPYYSWWPSPSEKRRLQTVVRFNDVVFTRPKQHNM